jgi:hypothetical protein
MKNLFLVISLSFVVMTGFSQNKKIAKLDEQLAQIYQSDEFLTHDMIVTPANYNPDGKEISQIDFYQDTANSINKVQKIYASIGKKDGFNSNYTIGRIYDYQSGTFEITVLMKIYYADGGTEVKTFKEHFDNIEIETEGVYSAEYSIDIDYVDIDDEEVVLN